MDKSGRIFQGRLKKGDFANDDDKTVRCTLKTIIVVHLILAYHTKSNADIFRSFTGKERL
jgi:hypothetical protein